MPILQIVLLIACILLPLQASLALEYTYGQQGRNLIDSGDSERYAGPHALVATDDETFSYNRNGDLISTQTSDGVQSNSYGTHRKLLEVRGENGATTHFFVTAMGNRVAVIHPNGRRESYASSQMQFTNDTPRFFYDGDTRSSEDGNQLWVSIHDHVGSVVATADAHNVLERVDRHPFGELIYHDLNSMEAGHNDRGFHNYEEEAGYTYFPARHLTKKHGRFIQADSLVPGPFIAAFNRYAYTYNDPINHTDPDGHKGRKGGKDGGQLVYEWLSKAFDLLRDDLPEQPKTPHGADMKIFDDIPWQYRFDFDHSGRVRSAVFEMLPPRDMFDIRYEIIRDPSHRGASRSLDVIDGITTNRYQISIPEGFLAEMTDNKRGIRIHHPDLPKNTLELRAMAPNEQHPTGYIRIYDKNGQPVDRGFDPAMNDETHHNVFFLETDFVETFYEEADRLVNSPSYARQVREAAEKRLAHADRMRRRAMKKAAATAKGPQP